MSVKIYRICLLVGCLSGLTQLASAQARGGSYSSSAVGPDLFQQGGHFWQDFPLDPIPLPGHAQITTVSWRWQRENIPTGTQVWLCYQHQSSTCLNISNQPSGLTSHFAGKAANQPLQLRWQVPGKGPLPVPSFGLNDQLAVNWQLPQ
ncbi:flagellar protein FlhE [Neisseriaceae bacterium TC5R-5]|nr:flagellar protein FlhE [Neisseriaceae bacterium TC5R-5]